MNNSNMEKPRVRDEQWRDPLASLPGYALRKAANGMMAELSDRLAVIGLKIADASVLLLTDQREDLTSSEIGKVLDIKSANMVPLLARLDAAGLIERRPIDRKSQAIVLTEAGLAKLADVQALTSQFEEDLLSRIPLEHRAHLLPALQALIR